MRTATERAHTSQPRSTSKHQASGTEHRGGAARSCAAPVERDSVIVAGYTGAPSGRSVVIEAGRLAGPEGRVFVVYAYREPPGYIGSPYFERRLADSQAVGRRALQALLGHTLCELPASEYIPELIAGRPADALKRVASARHAQAIVVGAPRRRAIGALRRRSVSHRLRGATPIQVITVDRSAPPITRDRGERNPAGARHERRSGIPPASDWW